MPQTVLWPVWLVVAILAGSGAIGGFISWLFIRERGEQEREDGKEERTFWNLLGNIVFGLLAPVFIIGIYGELSAARVNEFVKVPAVGLVVSALALGFGGARWWAMERVRRRLEATRARLAHAVTRLARSAKQFNKGEVK